MNLTLIKGSVPDGAFKPKCKVQLDNITSEFTDFVVVGHDAKTGKTTMIQHADTVTLGQAFHLIDKAFNSNYQALSSEDRQAVDNYFGGAVT